MAGGLAGDGDVAVLDIKLVADLCVDWVAQSKRLYQQPADMAGVIDPLRMMQTDFSIYMGMVLTYLPLMILPLYAVMVRLDDDVIEAATDLGASSVAVWWTVILPLTLPGSLPAVF